MHQPHGQDRSENCADCNSCTAVLHSSKASVLTVNKDLTKSLVSRTEPPLLLARSATEAARRSLHNQCVLTDSTSGSSLGESGSSACFQSSCENNSLMWAPALHKSSRNRRIARQPTTCRTLSLQRQNCQISQHACNRLTNPLYGGCNCGRGFAGDQHQHQQIHEISSRHP